MIICYTYKYRVALEYVKLWVEKVGKGISRRMVQGVMLVPVIWH
jgi:hypothetical protein